MAVSVAYQQNSSYPAAADRLAQVAKMTHGSAVSARSGVIRGGTTPLAVTASGGMGLSVAAGQAMVGDYTVTVDTATAVTVATSGATARWDLVILRVYEQEAGDSAPSRGAVEIVQGTTTADPTIPARSLVLARVLVGASVSSINSGNLTDRRVFTAAAGGFVTAAGALAASAGVFTAGTPVWDPTADAFGVVNDAGTGWRIFRAETYRPAPVAPTPAVNYSAAAAPMAPAVRQYGGLAKMTGWMVRNAAIGTVTGQLVGTLPAGLLPAARVIVPCMLVSGNTFGQSFLDLRTDGQILVTTVGTVTATTVVLDSVYDLA